MSQRIAVILPCYNEAATIAETVRGFRDALPEAVIHVFDNNSSDGTAEIARNAGALVRLAPWQGKGNVMRQAFREVDADIYVMSDGDTTYDAAAAPTLIRLLQDERLDMVVGLRQGGREAFPRWHGFGNRLFNITVGTVFRHPLQDMLSGYRVFSRRYVKSFPAHSKGFEIETELSVHAIELRLPMREYPTAYGSRPVGSQSKLRTWQDGWRILWTIGMLFRYLRPFTFFGIVALGFALLSLGFGIPVIMEWVRTGEIMQLPSAILATGLGVLASLSLVCGLILDGLARVSRETRYLRYLQYSG